MSRTYTHGLKARERYFGSPRNGPRNEWHHHLRGSRPKVRRSKHHMEWMNTPSAWNYCMHTRPWRRRVDQEIFREVRGKLVSPAWLEEHAEDDWYMPDGSARYPGAYRKPHIYYW